MNTTTLRSLFGKQTCFTPLSFEPFGAGMMAVGSPVPLLVLPTQEEGETEDRPDFSFLDSSGSDDSSSSRGASSDDPWKDL